MYDLPELGRARMKVKERDEIRVLNEQREWRGVIRPGDVQLGHLDVRRAFAGSHCHAAAIPF